MAKTKRVNVASGFGHRSRKPFVSLQLGDEFTQMDPAKAREIGGMLFCAAEAAETDAFLMQWCADVLEADDQGQATVLALFREYREKVLGQRSGTGPSEEAGTG